MHRWIIASDIHGSAYYCSQLIQRFEEENADRLILLGDILYHGPRNDLPNGYAPKEVIAMLNPLKDNICCVRGNCDAEVDQMVLDFSITDEYRILEFGDIKIYITHGHHENIDSLPDDSSIDVLLYGHTHIPLKKQKDGIWCLNPGSVSIPKEQSEHGYITLSDSGFEWKSLDGKVYDSLEFPLI